MDNGRVLKPGQCAQVEIQHLACVLLWDAQSFYQKRSMSIIPIVGVTFAHFQCSR